MPPPSTHSCLDLTLYPGLYFVSQVKEITADLFKSFSTGRFFSVTRTSDEISIVGEAGDDMPVEEAKWRCIRIAGPMDFGLTSVVASLTTPLGQNGIPVFVVSTYDTDYLLIPKEKIEEAVEVLKEDGWKFR